MVYYMEFLISLLTAQSDYDSQNISVTFGPDEFEKSVQVQITNDSLPERSEIFYGNLSISTQSRDLAEVTAAGATIEISYNDCKYNYISILTHIYCKFSFMMMPAYTCNEINGL